LSILRNIVLSFMTALNFNFNLLLTSGVFPAI
jgi:hypothetical protein